MVAKTFEKAANALVRWAQQIEEAPDLPLKLRRPLERDLRHLWARYFLETGMRWDDSFQQVSEMFENTPMRGGADAVRRDYQLGEAGLPPEQRRRRRKQLR